MTVTINGTTGIETNTDTGKIKVGASDDLQIYHDGSSGNSYILNTTGFLKIKDESNVRIDTDAFAVNKGDNSEAMIVATANGSVELYHDGNKKLNTSSTGIQIHSVEDGIASIELKADEGDDNADYWRVVSSNNGNFYIQNYAGGAWENNIDCGGNGSVVLYHNNVSTFETTQYGATCKLADTSAPTLFMVIGSEGQDAEIRLLADDGDDNADYWRFLADASDPDFYLQNYAGGGWETNIKATGNGGVKLYHNNDLQFESDSAGTIVYDHDNSVQTKYVSNTSTTCGYVYGQSDDEFGLLDKTGNWRIKAGPSGYQFYGTNHSDRDLKDNITTVSGSSLDKLNKLTAKSYNWKATENGKTDTSRTYVGFIAQEVQPHFPELVSGTDGKKDMGLDYSGLYTHAIKAIQELSAEVETLKTKVAALEAA